jgi:tetratricopeptide (TPR) repeat protein
MFRYKRFFLCVLPLIALLVQPVCAATKIVVFPLVNKSGNRNVDWAGYVAAESFSRRRQYCSDLQVIGPSFLFPVDSTGWEMNADSLLRLHWLRWGWNVACGGAYTVVQGRLNCEMRIIYLNNGRPQKKAINLSAAVDSADALAGHLFSQVASLEGSSFTKTEQQSMNRPLSLSPAARATYFAGFGYEMRNNIPAALSSYARCVELDPAFAYAFYRMARLYRACGAADKARELFGRALSLSENVPVIIADAADFYAGNDPASKVSAFLKKHKAILEQTAEGMTAIGKSLFASGEFQRAIAILTRAVARGAADSETDFILGRAYIATGDYAKAIDVFNRLVKYQPECARFYALLGAAYRHSGRIMESLKVLERSNAANPGNVALQVNLAQTYVDLGWYEKAEIVLRDALEENPDLPDLSVDLGVLSWYAGRRREYFVKASRMGANIQSAINNEANILVFSGNVNKAIDLYKKADRVGGKNEVILTNLANAYCAKNRLADAAGCYDAVLALSPDRTDVLEKCAFVAEKRGREADAILYLRKILELSPHDKDALTRLVGFMIKRGQFKESIEPVEAYLNDFPLDMQFLLLCAELYRRMGWYEVAIMKYEAIVKDYPDQPGGYLGLGKSMFDLVQFKNGKDIDKAIFYLKTAADLDKSNPEPEYIMGIIYLEHKNYRELALDSFRAALSKAEDPVVKKAINDLIAKAGK